MKVGQLVILVVILLVAVAVLVLERFDAIDVGLPEMACADGDLVAAPGAPAPERARFETLGLGAPSTLLPSTPGGEAMAWALGQLNAGFESLTEAAVIERFAPATLERVPASALLDHIRGLGLDSAPLGVVAVLDTGAPNIARIVTRTRLDRYVEVFVSVDPVAPHRIYDLIVGPYTANAPMPASTAPTAPAPTPAAPAAEGSAAPAQP
jgi:hypothetical protein